MNRPFALCCFAFGLALTSFATAQNAPTTAPTTRRVARSAPPGPPDVPAPQNGPYAAHFNDRHKAIMAFDKSKKIGVLFLGDSITEGWNKAPDIFKEHYGKYDPENFGIGADRTENVLWRIKEGELDGVSAKVVVLLIGTNNIGNSVDEILNADTKIVTQVHEKIPGTKVLILGIFPRGADTANANTKNQREKIKEVNAQLAKLDDGNKTRYLDFGDKYVETDGKISRDNMGDFLHPTVKGYQIWADAMQPLLDEMMK